MLKTVVRSIARFLAAMPKFVVEKVWAGGRWLTRLVAVPAAPAEPDIEPAAPAAVDGDAEHVKALRTAAAHLAAGNLPPEAALDRLREHDLQWLSILPQRMLCRVATASDDALRAHIRRQRPMRGLLATDPGAIADYKRATRPTAPKDDTEAKLDFVAA